MLAPTVLTAASFALLSPSAPAASREIPQLVVLPLESENGQARKAFDAWKKLVGRLRKTSKKNGFRTELQRKQHDFLVGPAREQAKDCKGKPACLIEIGEALQADYLVTGSLSKTIHLIAWDISAQKQLGTVTSSPRAKKLSKHVRSSAELLAKMVAKAQKDKSKAANGQAKKRKKKSSEPTTLAQGELLLPKDQLRGVQSVKIDGKPLSFQGDGSMIYQGSVGEHLLQAQHLDGRSLRTVFELTGKPSQSIALNFPAPQAAPPPPAVSQAPPPPAQEEQVTSKWWLWAALGLAAVAGGATFAVLAGGEKGGPSFPAQTGTIQGTY